MCAAPGFLFCFCLYLFLYYLLYKGGKTLVLAQKLTLIAAPQNPDVKTSKQSQKFGSLVANELSSDRRIRLKTTLRFCIYLTFVVMFYCCLRICCLYLFLFRNYLPPLALERVKITAHDATKWSERGIN
jgi:hypothetical protein